MKKGFTLIELLVVIGVMAVIAAGVIATINPQQKILQARDSQGQSGVGQLATGLQSRAAVNNGLYPSAGIPDNGLTALVTDGELTVLPAAPQGAAGGWVYSVNAGQTNACVSVAMQATRNRPSTCGGGAALCTHWAWCNTWGEARLNNGSAVAP